MIKTLLYHVCTYSTKKVPISTSLPPPPSLPSPLDVATPQARATKKTVIEHAKKVSKGNFISKSLQGPINLKFYASLQGANILS